MSKHKKVGSLLGMIVLAALSLGAQTQPGTVASLEFQKPKNGMVPQYEAGRKQKVAWHKQQNDPLPLYVWETLTGDDTGTYVVGRLGQHWTDLDKPAVPDQADIAEYQKVIGNYVESLTTHYYEYMPKVSNPDSDMTPTKFSEILTFKVHYGKGSLFNTLIGRIHDASAKTKWPVHYYWYGLVAGGSTQTYVLVLPHANWADFEDNPNVKPFREMLKEGMGQAEADSIVNGLDEAVKDENVNIVQFHPELSYMPGK
jgi:hypothetical protein